MPSRSTRLQRLLARLAPVRTGGKAPPIRDAWRLILLENVVYLADDEARARAFALLERSTAADPQTLLQCPDDVLLAACRLGRMAEQQVGKLRRCAATFLSVGDPRDLVRRSRPQARQALRRFPGIGDPGVDKLRLFAGVEAILALDSNGLRVLLRLGYGTEARSYATSYRSAQAAAMAELPMDAAAMLDAHLRLRAHGQHTCRRTAPDCPGCALCADCPSAR